MSRFVNAAWVALAALFAAALGAGSARGAAEFSPPGLYVPAVYRLDNGLRIVLAPRSGSRSVSIRAVVGLGTQNFPCHEQETAHFLEHLLFTGTSRHSEEELELLITSNGGSWNASTDDWETVYEIDIFSGNAALGIDTLHEILTDSTLSDAAIETSREVLGLEAGGAPSAAETLFERSGLFQSASMQAFNRLMSPRSTICVPEARADDVSRAEIEEAYRRYYVASNMSLIVVGDFHVAPMRSAIERTFGAMPAAPRLAPPKGDIPPLPGALGFTGFDDQPSAGFVFRTGGYLSPEHTALRVLEVYLDQRLYQVLRVERGLTYGPTVSYDPDVDVGLFWITAQVESENVAETQQLIEDEIDRIRDRDVDLDMLEKARAGLLFSYARSFESNAEIADYYVASLFELAAHGAFVDEEKRLKSLPVESILAAGAETFAPSDAVALHDRRFFFAEILAGSALASVAMLAYLPWRIFRRRKARAERDA